MIPQPRVRTGLDPFLRQIYMIEREGKQTIQTGIDSLPQAIAGRNFPFVEEGFDSLVLKIPSDPPC